MGGSQTMEARSPQQPEVSTVLPRIEMELYGPPHRVVCGGSIIRAGRLSELRGTLRPDPLRRSDLMRTGYCGHWLEILAPQWTSSIFCRGPDTSNLLGEICQSRGSRWTRIEP